ncbi:hypothetical protein COO91_11261 (plasmid) [Nostoc flagelliforme CCNUN1]|uniref:Uncharacterized protein n=1 Tax=Nostoc flagelliforme CCNUN1 TaxID=2038116 RepID=A0A2K8TAK1_9NOSO|nr:hypothetical protein [Nostoc flagelliforme]AUB44105.1 hypothetical protein COO91_10323 [Nostoc flagelliforme CCNUN1]AUB45004.1 hypothetical protein COO91_11261 [Nostoc flagelliforme CCNUN1]
MESYCQIAIVPAAIRLHNQFQLGFCLSAIVVVGRHWNLPTNGR